MGKEREGSSSNLWERGRRALEQTRAFHLLSNGLVQRRRDSNYASSENVDEDRRKEKVKTRRERFASAAGSFTLITEYKERQVTGRRIRFEQETKTPIPDAEIPEQDIEIDVTETSERAWSFGQGSRRIRDNAHVKVNDESEPNEVALRLKHKLPPPELKPSGISLEALQAKGIHLAAESSEEEDN